MFSDKNEGHRDGEEASVDIFCLLSFSFSPSSVQPKKGFDASGGGVRGGGRRAGVRVLCLQVGEFGLREPDHSALCKPPKGGSCTNEQTHRISSGHKSSITLTPKSNVIEGKIQGLTRSWVF